MAFNIGYASQLATVQMGEFDWSSWNQGGKNRGKSRMDRGVAMASVAARMGLGKMHPALLAALVAAAVIYGVLAPSPTKETNEEMLRDIAKFLRGERQRYERQKRMAPGPPVGGDPEPFIYPYPYPEPQRFSNRRVDPPTEEDKRESFRGWLERRYGRKHPARYMRRRRF